MNQDIDPKWGESSPFHDPYALANFVARPTDVLITTGPKAGTTWMQQILYQLKTGGDDTYRSIFDVVPWLEWPQDDMNWKERLTSYEAMENPRVFKTHCTYEQTPGLDTLKVILSSRDPRDCCISFYHHLNDLTDEIREKRGIVQPESFDQFFEEWMSFGAWFRNIKSWWPHINDENILWLRYEDMKKDLGFNMDKILDFLGWQLTTEEKASALKFSSFEWMKDNSEKFTVHSGHKKPMFKPGGFIRKGQVGDHKHHLSKEQESQIMERVRAELEPDCIRYLGLE